MVDGSNQLFVEKLENKILSANEIGYELKYSQSDTISIFFMFVKPRNPTPKCKVQLRTSFFKRREVSDRNKYY